MVKPTDIFYAGQWHFDALGNGRGRAAIETVWDEFTGAGISVGVYDDGIQKAHSDINDNYDPTRHVVVGGVVRDGETIIDLADPGNGHGHACAGIIGAENNGQGTVGIAYDCSLTGVNIFDENGAIFLNAPDPAGFLSAVAQMANFDVTSNSWGSTPAFGTSQNLNNPNGFDARTVAAYETVVETGRDGLGTIIVQCVQNQNLDANGDGLYTTRYAIKVGSMLETGFAASYSNYGACLLVAAPGGDTKAQGGGTVDHTRLVTTADLAGEAGFNLVEDENRPIDFTNSFNGTSAATPMVSGVVALMLDANPDLGWRDVQEIIALTAFDTGSGVAQAPGLNENTGWGVNFATDWNGGGRHFSNDYGFGSIDAFGAVRLAEAYAILSPVAQTSANELLATSGTITGQAQIVDGQTNTYTVNIAADIKIEHVDLTLGLTHVNFPDLRIILRAPDGAAALLYDGRTGNSATASGGLTWTFGAETFRGETSAGNWRIEILDTFGNSGTNFVSSIRVDAYGRADGANDVYTYTDEFAAMAAINGTRFFLNDIDVGTDWFNGAALSGHAAIDLSGAQLSVVAGGLLNINANVIENAITGDGNDGLYGTSATNRLHGMRGDDFMEGRGGADFLFGGDGSDQLFGGDANDTLDGGPGNDAINGGDGADFVTYASAGAAVTVSLAVTTAQNTGGGGTDTITLAEHLIGSAFNDNLTGNNGSNSLNGGGGADRTTGGLGNDVHVVNHAGDVVVELADQGTDAVQSSISYTLAANIETLTLTGAALAGTGNAGANTINGHAGANTLMGGGGNDILNGNAGADTLDGGAGDDQHFGGADNDGMRGSTGADAYDGGADIDTVNFAPSSGVNVFLDGSGTNGKAALGDTFANVESILGGIGADFLVGDGADNRFVGNLGNDVLWGRGGADILEGGAGADRLWGGAGSDVLTGGADADRFVFADAPAAGGVDRTNDFAAGVDKIEIDASAFGGGLAAGGAVQFTSGSAPSSAGFLGGVFLYDTDDGFLRFDADGQGAGAAVAFFRIQNIPALGAADFVVVA